PAARDRARPRASEPPPGGGHLGVTFGPRPPEPAGRPVAHHGLEATRAHPGQRRPGAVPGPGEQLGDGGVRRRPGAPGVQVDQAADTRNLLGQRRHGDPLRPGLGGVAPGTGDSIYFVYTKSITQPSNARVLWVPCGRMCVVYTLAIGAAVRYTTCRHAAE